MASAAAASAASAAVPVEGAAAAAAAAHAETKLADIPTAACKARGGDPQPLPADQLQARLGELCPTWTYDEERKTLSRCFIAKNFKAALSFINAAGDVAEAASHHPDLHITDYRKVCVEIRTHSCNQITLNDFIVAARLDRIPIMYSPKFKREHPDMTAGI